MFDKLSIRHLESSYELVRQTNSKGFQGVFFLNVYSFLEILDETEASFVSVTQSIETKEKEL